MMKLMPQIRYTLLGTGFVIGYATSLFSGQVLYEYILLILLCAGIYIVQTKGIKVLLYLFANVVVYMILIPNFSFHVIFLAMFAFNLVYYIFQRKEQSTNYTAFVLALLSFMGLAFLDLQTCLQVVYTLIFLMTVAMIILSIDSKLHKLERPVGFISR